MGATRQDAPGPDEVESFAEAHAQDIRAICFEQWLCDRQLARAAARGKAAGLSLGLYRDLAVGAAPDGGEVLAERDLFMHGASVGAPPDPFAEGGQVWGLPPPNPLAMARSGFEAFKSLLRANMRHAGALRIDHVMALQRLFVVPEGRPALDGAYLSYPLDDLLGELALESFRAKCLVIGEDLGTVPDGIREKLALANVLSYRVLFFERWGDDFAPPAAYPRKALACASTHDLPTLIGWRRGADIEEKAALGLLSPEAAEAEQRRRQSDMARLAKALAADNGLPADGGDLPDPDFVAAVHAFLAKTPSALALVQIDDLLGETNAVNLPGTDRERPNWRRKLTHEAAGALAHAIHARKSQRRRLPSSALLTRVATWKFGSLFAIQAMKRAISSWPRSASMVWKRRCNSRSLKTAWILRWQIGCSATVSRPRKVFGIR